MSGSEGAGLPQEAVGRPYNPWPRGLAWLALLAPLFFASYNFANRLAAESGRAGVVVFDWERHIPFVPWTILPYWSIDLLYGLAFLLCRSPRDTDRLGLRLLSAQLISVACFLAFPLRFSFERPAAEGWAGAMFTALAGFDLPYNQAPSLHISLLLILWLRYASSSPARWRWLVHGWAMLIGVSVLTTYQHHFLDLPTGLWVGALCLWLWPDQGPSPWQAPLPRTSPRHRRLAVLYAGGALLLALASTAGGAALWLAWPATALALVAANYAWLGPAGFQKGPDGRLSLASRLLFAPYLLAAWLNSRLWTWRAPAPRAVADGVWLGRMPSRLALQQGGFMALCDVCAELPAPRGHWHSRHHPWLDLVVPSVDGLRAAAHDIDALLTRAAGAERAVLVCCALGYSRSACAVAAWLLLSGRAASVAEAEAQLAARIPRLVLHDEHRAALQALADARG